jgi:uncharacterized DUF497 family protein
MESDERCSWDDGKRSLNLTNHGYDFGDLHVVFDGRFVVTRPDRRFDYGEDRFNMLVAFEGRVINVTFTPRGRHMHLISARPASREERSVYHERRQNS